MLTQLDGRNNQVFMSTGDKIKCNNTKLIIVINYAITNQSYLIEGPYLSSCNMNTYTTIKL